MSLVRNFQVSEEGRHIAIMVYSSRNKIVVNFDSPQDPVAINKKIEDINYGKWKQSTYINKALDEANSNIFIPSVMRDISIPKVRVNLSTVYFL